MKFEDLKMTWRDRVRPIIAAVIAEHGEGPGLRKALREAYPFGLREYHPYKVWLDEIRVQRGLKPAAKTKTNAKTRRKETPAAGLLFNKTP